MIRWQAAVPESVNPATHRVTPRRLLGIVLAADKAAAERRARGIWGGEVTVQSVLSLEAERDDFSAIKRTRPKGPCNSKEYQRVRKCKTCGVDTEHSSWYCSTHDTPELRRERILKHKRAYNERRRLARQATQPCAWEGCEKPVRGGYCNAHIAILKRRCKWPGCPNDAELAANRHRKRWCHDHAGVAKRAV